MTTGHAARPYPVTRTRAYVTRLARGHRSALGFTLLEMLVAVAIAAAMLSMMALALQRTTGLVSEVTTRDDPRQQADELFRQIQRDLQGLTKSGVLLVRQEGLDPAGASVSSSLMGLDNARVYRRLMAGDRASGSEAYGDARVLNLGRADWLAMVSTGHFQTMSGAVGGRYDGLRSNAARVIYAHTNRVLANQREDWREIPRGWAANWTLVRHQTCLLPGISSSNVRFLDSGLVDPSAIVTTADPSPGLSFDSVPGDVADLALHELLAMAGMSLRDGLTTSSFAQRTSGGQFDLQQTPKVTDFAADRPEVAFLRIKRDDLLPEQIRDTGEVTYAGQSGGGSASSGAGSAYAVLSSSVGPICEGYQRPRLLPSGPGPDGISGTADDDPTSMGARVAAARCSHFRVDVTHGDVDNNGILQWLDLRQMPLLPGDVPDATVQLRGADGQPTLTAFAVFTRQSPLSQRQRAARVAPTDPASTPVAMPWPQAIRVQVVLIDADARDPYGRLFERIFVLP